jgi:small conductance mechanosensitive channel
MFEDLNIEAMANTFIFPYAANIALAIVIFIVGRWLANTLTDVVVRLLKKSRMDDMLISFVASITKTILLLFVAIAALNKLGIDTTSLIALLGAAGLAGGSGVTKFAAKFCSRGSC